MSTIDWMLVVLLATIGILYIVGIDVVGDIVDVWGALSGYDRIVDAMWEVGLL